MTLELFEQGPGVYIPLIVVSLLVTLIAYGAFPLLYARFKKKPLTASKYKWKCYGFNFIPMVLFFLLSDRTPAGPYILWTSVFCHSGLKTLVQRNLIVDNNVPVSTPSSVTDMEYTGKFQQTAAATATPVKQKKAKNRFCKLCGSPVDPSTKKCSSCGKQYFRLPVRKKSNFIPKVVVFLSLLIVGLCIYRNVQYRDQIAGLNARISELESVVEAAEAQQASDKALILDLRKKNAGNSSKVYTLSQQIEEMEPVYNFCKRNLVFTDFGLYHKADCFVCKFNDYSTEAYTVAVAKQKGFSPCWVCCD